MARDQHQTLSDVTPLVIRFPKGELARARSLAKIEHRSLIDFVRPLVLRYASDKKQAALHYETAHGLGEQLTIRFLSRDRERIQRIAKREGQSISAWIRAVVMTHIRQGEKS